MKKLLVNTYGCQMNVRDSEEVSGLLLDRGFCLTPSQEEADVILFNTCSVREHAEERVWSNVGALKDLKARRPELVIGVMGCMAKAQRGKIFKRLSHVDFISGPAQLYGVPELIEAIYEERRPMAAIQEKRRPEFQQISYHSGSVTALVTIMEGCDKVCSYCIIPYTRGPEVSRPPEQVIQEVRDLAARGYREVTLLGQNVNSYGKRFPGEPLAKAPGLANKVPAPLEIPSALKWDPSFLTGPGRPDPFGFAGLLKQVNAVPGIERIRFITSHPWDAVEDLFAAMRDCSHVCEHLHLPVQSGSDEVLKRMRRGYTAREYLEKLALLRRLIPEVAVTTDIIVGFPGETEEDFNATIHLMEEAQFDSAFIFSYSPRPFSAASRWPDDVPQQVKDRRLQNLLKLQERITRCHSGRYLGQTVELLVEESASDGPKGKPRMGRTRTNRKVYFEGNSVASGELVQVKVEGIRGQSLLGKMVFSLLLMTQAAVAQAKVDPASLQAAFLRGEYDQVVAGTKQLLDSKNSSQIDELLYLQGVSALKLHDLELSRSSLERLFSGHPRSRWVPFGWMALGELWAIQGEKEKALKSYEELLQDERSHPVFPQATFRLGQMQRSLGRWEEAKASFHHLILQFPQSLEATQAKEILEREDFHFSVQVGAFGSWANAQRLKAELERRGYETAVSQAVLEARRLHRVRVGRFSRRDEAEEMAQRLHSEGFPGRVVP